MNVATRNQSLLTLQQAEHFCNSCSQGTLSCSSIAYVVPRPWRCVSDIGRAGGRLWSILRLLSCKLLDAICRKWKQARKGYTDCGFLSSTQHISSVESQGGHLSIFKVLPKRHAHNLTLIHLFDVYVHWWVCKFGQNSQSNWFSALLCSVVCYWNFVPDECDHSCQTVDLLCMDVKWAFLKWTCLEGQAYNSLQTDVVLA